MRRWDRLLDIYMEEYRARGVRAATVECTESRLERWGRWLKKRRPRVSIEQIGGDLNTVRVVTARNITVRSTITTSIPSACKLRTTRNSSRSTVLSRVGGNRFVMSIALGTIDEAPKCVPSGILPALRSGRPAK